MQAEREGSALERLDQRAVAILAVPIGAGRLQDEVKAERVKLAYGGTLSFLIAVVLVLRTRWWWAALPVSVWLPSLLLAGLLALMIWRQVTRPQYGLSSRMPRWLSAPARLFWTPRLFLGWSTGVLGNRRMALSLDEDSVGIVGPPRVLKTLGILIVQALLWKGAMVATSTKPDLFERTAERRRRLAARYGGQVLIYAPTEELAVKGVQPFRWSPLVGCEHPRVATQRVLWFVEAARVGEDVKDRSYWRSGAASVLVPLFVAGAHHPLRPGDLTVVWNWLLQWEIEEPLTILRALNRREMDRFVDALLTFQQMPGETRKHFFSMAQQALDFCRNPQVLESCTGTEIDADEFIRTHSTLYVLSPTTAQKEVAPLIAALIEWLTDVQYRRWGLGRRAVRLHLLLDEVANIARLPALESILSQGAGQGVNVTWTAQSLDQLRHHWGAFETDAIWGATRCRLIFPGIADEGDLNRVSALVGHRKVKEKTFLTISGQQRQATADAWRPRVSPHEVREIKKGWALLIYHNERARLVRVPLGWKVWAMQRGLLKWAETPAAAMEQLPDEVTELGPNVVPMAPAAPTEVEPPIAPEELEEAFASEERREEESHG